MGHSSNDTFPSHHRTELPNGLRIVTEHIPSVRSVSVGAWVFTGSRDETLEHSGISHFIEHMVFKGTARRRTHHIAQRMEAVGGFLNAFTGKEYTCYYARALDEHLDRAIDTVTDLILEPQFPKRELEKEKEVVIEEMKMYEDNPEDLVFDRFEALAYPDHPLGRPIIGLPETVRAFSREQLVGYLSRHYTPAQTVIAVAGNVDHDRVAQVIADIYDQVDRPTPERSRTPVNGYTAQTHVEERPIQQAHLVLGTRCFDIYDPRRIALSVLNTLLGGGMSSRLNQNIREKYGYCYSIYSFINLHSDTGDFGVYMGTDASKVERSKKLIYRELDKLASTAVSQRMLNQAKNQVKGSIMMGLESMSNRMMRLGRQELYYDRYISLDEMLEQIDAVTAEDIRSVADTLFQADTFSEVVLLPSEA